MQQQSKFKIGHLLLLAIAFSSAALAQEELSKVVDMRFTGPGITRIAIDWRGFDLRDVGFVGDINGDGADDLMASKDSEPWGPITDAYLVFGQPMGGQRTSSPSWAPETSSSGCRSPSRKK